METVLTHHLVNRAVDIYATTNLTLGTTLGVRAINVGKISNPKLNFIPYILIQIPKFNQYIKKDLYYYDYK